MNESDNGCPVYSDPEVSLNDFWKATVITAYTLVSILAITGNGAVIFIVVHFRKLHTVNNYFIFNLAIADLLIALLCIPFSYWTTLILGYWAFGNFMCKLIHFGQATSVYLSSYTLVVISIDRFLAVMFPMRFKFRLRPAICTLAGVWLLSVGTAAPILVVQQQIDTEVGPQCDEIWFGDDLDRNDFAKFAFSQTVLILQYLLPLGVLMVTYGAIGVRTWFSAPPGETSSKLAKSRRKSVRKPIIMMFVVSLVYAICWLPLNSLFMMVTKCSSYAQHPYILYIFWGCHLTAMSHSAMNPFLYVITSRRYREGFRFIFRYLPGVNYVPKELLNRRQTLSSYKSYTVGAEDEGVSV